MLIIAPVLRQKNSRFFRRISGRISSLSEPGPSASVRASRPQPPSPDVRCLNPAGLCHLRDCGPEWVAWSCGRSRDVGFRSSGHTADREAVRRARPVQHPHRATPAAAPRAHETRGPGASQWLARPKCQTLFLEFKDERQLSLVLELQKEGLALRSRQPLRRSPDRASSRRACRRPRCGCWTSRQRRTASRSAVCPDERKPTSRDRPQLQATHSGPQSRNGHKPAGLRQRTSGEGGWGREARTEADGPGSERLEILPEILLKNREFF